MALKYCVSANVSIGFEVVGRGNEEELEIVNNLLINYAERC
jgi:hypothetical protein